MNKKIKILFMCIFFGGMFCCNIIYGQTDTDDYVYNISSGVEESRALKLETRYRKYNGYLQCRRWDVQNECWYDPAWITIGKV